MGLNIAGLEGIRRAAAGHTRREAIEAAQRRVRALAAEDRATDELERRRAWTEDERPRLLARQTTYADELRKAGATVALAEVPMDAPSWYRAMPDFDLVVAVDDDARR